MTKLKEHLMTESSLSKVYRKMLKHDSGTITAFRDRKDCGNGDKFTTTEKNAMNKTLLAKLSVKKYSITKVKGEYIEGYGSSDEKKVGESVYFVVDSNDTGKLKRDLMILGEEFEQDSILFIAKGAESGHLIGTNHCDNGYPGYGVVKKLKNPIFGKGGQFQTKVSGRPFILKENIEEIHLPQTNLGRYAMDLFARKKWQDNI